MPISLSLPAPSLWAQLWHSRLLFMATFVSIFVLTMTAVFSLPKHYSAIGTIIVAVPDSVASSNNRSDSSWQEKVGDQADMESVLRTTLSPRLVRMVVNSHAGSDNILAECRITEHSLLRIAFHLFEVELPQVYDMVLSRPTTCEETVTNSDLKVDWATENYKSAAVGRSRLITISYTSALPHVAESMVDLLIVAFLEDQKAKRVEPRDAGIAFLRSAIAKLDESLQSDEAHIQMFRKTHGLLQGEFSSITAERLSDASKSLGAAQTMQANAAAQLQTFETGDGANLPMVLQSLTIANLKKQISEQSAKLSRLKQSITPDSPILGPAVRELADTTNKLKEETNKIQSSIHLQYQVAGLQVAALTKLTEQLKRDASEASGYETQIASMVRDNEVKRTLFIELSKQANQLQTERESLSATSQLVNLAEFPKQPSFPKKLPFAVGGMALAGIIASAVAISRKDLKVRTPNLLPLVAGVPVLSCVPRVTKVGLRSPNLPFLLTKSSEPSYVQEAIRRLHAQLSIMGFGRTARTVLVTSTDAQEGKSFTATALAQFAAHTGQKVLLVESDLRKPAINQAMHSDAQHGLVDFLSGTVSELPIVASTKGFDVIFAGIPSVNSTELLAGSRFGQMLSMVESYDLVVVDSPPCGALMDASVMAPLMDGIIYCVRLGNAETMRVASVIDHLRLIGGKVVGTVVTFSAEDEPQPYSAFYAVSDDRAA